MADQAGQQPNAQPQQNQQQPNGEQPAPKTYAQDDVDRIVEKVRRNTRREVERTMRRELDARVPPAQPPSSPEKKDPPAEDQEPKRETFDSYEEYGRELAKFEGRKAAREERVKAEGEAKAKTERESQEKAAATWKGKIEQAMAKVDDFEDVMEDNPEVLDVIAGSRIREACVESDIGPLIIYELCKNPAEAKRIAALSGYKQAAEVAKIEERLTAAAAPAPKDGEDDDTDPDEKGGKKDPSEKPDANAERNPDGTFKPKKEPSKAPAPIEPVGGRPANSSAAPSDKDDADTWRRKRTAEVLNRQQGK